MKKNDEDQPGWRRTAGHLVQHLRDGWPAAIFVATLFTVLDHAVGWLDAIDGHGFVAIGNAAGALQPLFEPDGSARDDGKVKAIVVQIDPTAAETRYLDRSPLDRCQLRADLQTVYAAMKAHGSDVLVVDLDLSPARWLKTEAGRTSAEAQCERDLYQTIEEAASIEPKVRTVLMSPFKAVDPGVLEDQEEWIARMKPHVTFGNATLPLKYGLVIKQYCGPDSLAGRAQSLVTIDAEKKRKCRELSYIDPRKYRSVVPVRVSDAPQPPVSLRERLDRDLANSGNKADGQAKGVPAVFFGAAFGEGDTFVTPFGELYGVEIHAAGFLSLLDPIDEAMKIAALLGDIGLGFLFGLAIEYFWARYFADRLSADSDDRLFAPVWLLGLAAAVFCMAVALTVLSWWLLASWGLWLSPIPMAIGMMIESFVSGSVAQGIREADALKGQGRPPRRSFRQGARQFFGADIFHFWKKGKRLSAALLALRLTTWIAVVAAALYFALFSH
jgi:hypothetical protein